MVSSITASHSLLGMVSNFFSSWQHMSKYFIAPSDSDVNLLTLYSRSRRSNSTSELPVVNQSVVGPRLGDRPVWRTDLPPINQVGSGVRIPADERRGHGTETVHG